ncbi:MAG: MTAP family purine nucleoside phosphorylase [Proteobacteria bacterium]|nr:MTAP family purine nucleoside phosphorylase [Pseudomonadota bacterium]
MAERIGLLAGTVFYRKDYFAQAEKRTIDTKFGKAEVLLTDRWAYVPRHGLEGSVYVPAHRVNHAANITALKSIGVREVVGINSTGSLRPSLVPGSVVLPHDYISLACVPSICENEPMHITPHLSELVRVKLQAAAEKAGVPLVNGGVYWQNPGPRLETRSEILFQSHYADMVGMTLASEATISQELTLEYGSLCSVDNHGHGLSHTPLTAEEIMANAAANADKMWRIIQAYPELG